MNNPNDKERSPQSSAESADPTLANSASITDNSAGETGAGPSGIRGGGTDLSEGSGALGIMGNMSRNENTESEEPMPETEDNTNDPNASTWSEYPDPEDNGLTEA